jgi:hypothetical protein
LSSSTYSGYQLGEREKRNGTGAWKKNSAGRKRPGRRSSNGNRQMEIIAEKERLAVFRRLSVVSSTISKQEDPVRTRTAGGKKEGEVAPERAWKMEERLRAVKERLGKLRQLTQQAASPALQQKVFDPVLTKVEAVPVKTIFLLYGNVYDQRLLGAPSGYVGYEEGGQLTNRRN